MLAGLRRWLPSVGPLIAAVIALAVIALVASQAHAQEPSAPGPQAFKPEFSPGACPERLDVPDDAFLKCGYVTVLEDRAKPDGRTIELYVVRIRALSPIRHRDPVIYLAGGPGGSATRRTQWFLDRGRSLWTGRDLVLFDQRGIGNSKPRLECAQYRHDYADIRNRDLDPDEELEWSVEALLGCKRTLSDRGIDLSAYTSASTAADVADIVSAMDFDSFNLYGTSYGTLLALTVMRDFPAGVRSVILDGVLPLQISLYETYYAEWAAAVDRFSAIARPTRRVPGSTRISRRPSGGQSAGTRPIRSPLSTTTDTLTNSPRRSSMATSLSHVSPPRLGANGGSRTCRSWSAR